MLLMLITDGGGVEYDPTRLGPSAAQQDSTRGGFDCHDTVDIDSEHPSHDELSVEHLSTLLCINILGRPSQQTIYASPLSGSACGLPAMV